MTVDELTSLDADEMAELVEWRMDLLLEAGYDAADASLLARRVDVSVWEAVRVVSEGMEPTDAVVALT
jgi:hypothetical protein